MSVSGKIESLSVSELHFDRENPRLSEFGVDASWSEQAILELLWDTMDVQELVQSIHASGFFPHEPIVVEERKDGGFVVLEGNRRLAAVKVLLGAPPGGTSEFQSPELLSGDRAALKQLPAIRSNRRDAWRFLGFKHVNGPAKWSGYAKAHYIAEVHRDHGVSLSDIARQIGDRNRTVQRLYRGLMVLQQAERAKVFDRENRYYPRFAFSHLYTGLGYSGVAGFLGIESKDPEDPTPVPPEKMKELGELLGWFYGSKRDDRRPHIQSQNPDLRTLDEVLPNREALSALRAGEPLSRAHEISRPPLELFETALHAAKRELTTASAHLATGDDESEALLRVAGTIADMADRIYDEMERRRNPAGRKKRLVLEA